MAKNKHLGLRTDDTLRVKLKYIAEYEGRSMNGQVTHLIQNCIRGFEQEHGAITEEELRRMTHD